VVIVDHGCFYSEGIHIEPINECCEPVKYSESCKLD